jgi:drug/metabolite transporter (DMT)-like permease
MKKYLAIFGLVLVAIIWGGGFVASDMALKSFSPFQIMTLRFLLSTVIMTVIGWKQIKIITKKEAVCGCILGFFLFAGFAFQIVGLQYTTPSKNAFLTATNVIFVPLLAYVIFRKKAGLKTLIGTGLAIIGAGILSLQSDFTLGIGDGLTLLCAVCFAAQVLLTGRFVEKIRPTVLNFLQMATALVLSFGGLLITGDFSTQITVQGGLSVLYLGIVSTTITYLLQTICQRYVEETKTSIILSTEAVFGTLFSIIILREEVTLRMILGSILILSAVVVSEINGKKAV